LEADSTTFDNFALANIDTRRCRLILITDRHLVAAVDVMPSGLIPAGNESITGRLVIHELPLLLLLLLDKHRRPAALNPDWS
jgi:hypothetical protein